jgi:hypothetical protein
MCGGNNTGPNMLPIKPTAECQNTYIQHNLEVGNRLSKEYDIIRLLPQTEDITAL